MSAVAGWNESSLKAESEFWRTAPVHSLLKKAAKALCECMGTLV